MMAIFLALLRFRCGLCQLCACMQAADAATDRAALAHSLLPPKVRGNGASNAVGVPCYLVDHEHETVPGRTAWQSSLDFDVGTIL